MKELYEEEIENIQTEFDKHRVDEWHSVIPLSEDGAIVVYEDICEVSSPNGYGGPNNLFLHEEEQGYIEPKDSYTSKVFTMLFEDDDYIFSTLVVRDGDSHHECELAQLTRHDKQRHIVTREEWENSYTCG